MSSDHIEYVYALYVRDRLVGIVTSKDTAMNCLSTFHATRFEEYTLDRVQGYATSPLSVRGQKLDL